MHRLLCSLALLLALALFSAGCATGRADAGAANPTSSWSAGVLAVEQADVVRTHVTVSDWPVGMDDWTPEQLSAFVQARGAAGNPGNVGDLFYSRQDVKVGTDQRGGTASPTNDTPIRVDANLDAPAGGAADVAAKALGIGGESQAGKTTDAAVPAPPATGETPE